jgi:hypothetical protein
MLKLKKKKQEQDAAVDVAELESLKVELHDLQAAYAALGVEAGKLESRAAQAVQLVTDEVAAYLAERATSAPVPQFSAALERLGALPSKVNQALTP